MIPKLEEIEDSRKPPLTIAKLMRSFMKVLDTPVSIINTANLSSSAIF
jgi:hypothetical protein